MNENGNGLSAADVAAVVDNNRGGYGWGGYPMMGYPVMPMMGGYGGGFGGYGGDWSWIIILFLFAALGGGGWGGFGGFGGFGGGFEFPWLLTGQQNVQNGVNANTDAAINQLSTQNALSSIQNSITTGFSNAEVANCNRAIDALQTSYNNQIAALNRSFDAQTAVDTRLDTISSDLQKCCCDNELRTEQLRFTVATENAADREALSNGIRDLLSAQTAGTQRILDKLCDQELAAAQRENQELRTRLNMADLAASQAAQTAQLVADNTAQTQYIVNRVAPYPIPAYPVSNPYGCNGFGYGYGNGFGFNNGFNPFGNVGFGNGSF